jgi:hypothetical protein
MQLRIQLFAVIALVGLVVLVLELIRRRRLMERYAIVWLAAVFALLGLAVSTDVLESFSNLLGIAYPPTALFVVAFAFIALLLLHFSTAVSRLTDQVKILAQEHALMDKRLRDAEHAGGQPDLVAAGRRPSTPESA